MNRDLKKKFGPVDIVYTWVNGNDPVWIKKKDKALKTFPYKLIRNSNSHGRFDNHDELKFSLRSVDKYLPWIHKIYIITNNQVPQWLNTKNNKVVIINHKDIFPKTVKTPVFNSNLIETFITNINELSDKYIYFNDDFLINRPLKKHHFFTLGNKPIYFTYRQPIGPPPPFTTELNQNTDSKTINRIINYFSRRHKFNWYSYENAWSLFQMEHPQITEKIHVKHTPRAFIKSERIEILNHYYPYIKQILDNQFRTKFSLFLGGLYIFNSYYQGKSVLKENINDVFDFGMGSKYYHQDIDDIVHLFNPKYKFLCISQGSSYNQKYIDTTMAALKLRFPSPSKFEKKDSNNYLTVNESNLIVKLMTHLKIEKSVLSSITHEQEALNIRYETEIKSKNALLNETRNILDKIYSGNLWRLAQLYFRVRDKIIKS